MSEHLDESNKTATLRWFGRWERGNRSRKPESILLDARKMAKFAQAGEGDEAGMWTKPCARTLATHGVMAWKFQVQNPTLGLMYIAQMKQFGTRGDDE